jgi:hypothetical protein
MVAIDVACLRDQIRQKPQAAQFVYTAHTDKDDSRKFVLTLFKNLIGKRGICLEKRLEGVKDDELDHFGHMIDITSLQTFIVFTE